MLLLGLLALVGVCTAAAGGEPGDQLRLLAGLAIVYLVGRFVCRDRLGQLCTAVAVAGGAAFAVLSAPDGLSGAATAGPLGYGNANGALCLLGVAGALVAGALLPRPAATAAALPAALVLTWLAAQTGSQAATVLSGLLVAVAVALRLRPSLAPVAPRLAAVVLLLSVMATVALAIPSVRDLAVAGALGDGLSTRRVALWSDAAELVRLSPWDGVGAGRFSAVAPTALVDDDARWAHSVWLQQAAETGVVGGALLLALGTTAVLAGRRTSPASAVAAAAVAAVLVQASIDYVLHFPLICALTALLCSLSVTHCVEQDRSTSNR